MVASSQADRGDGRLAAAAAALLLVAGCGGASPGSHASHAGIAGGAAAPSAGPPPSPAAEIPASATGGVPLTIFAVGPGGSPGGLRCPDWFVLAGDRTEYSSAEIQQIRDVFAVPPFDSLPPTVQRAPGPLVDTAKGINPAISTTCSIDLQITNDGRTPVQIPQVGLQFTAPPEANGQVYRLFEVCSLEGAAMYCGPSGFGGGPAPCNLYTLEVDLDAAGAGGPVFGRPVSTQPDGAPCPVITLGRGASVEVIMAVESSRALVFHVAPVLTVVAAGGPRTVPLPELAGTLPFVSPAQVECYQLSGQTFSRRWSGLAAAALRHDDQPGAWCA